MNPYIQEKNVDQVVKWLQATQDVNAIRYLIQEAIIRLRELHENNLADQYTTSHKSTRLNQPTAPPSPPATLTFHDGFRFGVGFYLAGLLCGAILATILLIFIALLGGSLLTF